MNTRTLGFLAGGVLLAQPMDAGQTPAAWVDPTSGAPLSTVSRQTAGPPTLRAIRLAEPLRIDGRLDEARVGLVRILLRLQARAGPEQVALGYQAHRVVERLHGEDDHRAARPPAREERPGQLAAGGAPADWWSCPAIPASSRASPR